MCTPDTHTHMQPLIKPIRSSQRNKRKTVFPRRINRHAVRNIPKKQLKLISSKTAPKQSIIQPNCWRITATPSIRTIRITENPPPTNTILRRRNHPSDKSMAHKRLTGSANWTNLHLDRTKKTLNSGNVFKISLHSRKYTTHKKTKQQAVLNTDSP